MRKNFHAAMQAKPYVAAIALLLSFLILMDQAYSQQIDNGHQNLRSLFSTPSQWTYTDPVVSPESRESETSHAQKDPTIVHFGGQWHLFMTVKLEDRTVLEYCCFKSWDEANTSQRHLLRLVDSRYFCAPQVFYYEPQKLWYLIYQVGHPGDRFLRVAYSTTASIEKPESWSQARYCLDAGPRDTRTEGGLDFWVICDEQRAYLFYTSPGGKLWRLWTTREKFPHGFRDCQLALRGEFFEASHIYYVKDWQRYLNLIEQDGRRYYKAYIAEQLDGEWLPLADSEKKPFAGMVNIAPAANIEAWTDNVSHGELLREGHTERLEVRSDKWKFLFQGMLETEKRNKNYGGFRWRLGLLEGVPTSKP